MQHVADIVTPERSYPVLFNVASYLVPGIRFTTKRGQVRVVYGCKTDREAFIIAKRLARQAGKDVSGWKLVFVS